MMQNAVENQQVRIIESYTVFVLVNIFAHCYSTQQRFNKQFDFFRVTLTLSKPENPLLLSPTDPENRRTMDFTHRTNKQS